jgi:hypothetical protein
MSGAIFFHAIGPIGIDPYGDGGMLFREAIFTWAMGVVVVAVHRHDLAPLAARFGLAIPFTRAA